MIKTPLPSPIPIPVQPTLVFGASHIPDSIAEGNPDRKEIIYLAGKIIVIREMLSQKVNLIRLSGTITITQTMSRRSILSGCHLITGTS